MLSEDVFYASKAHLAVYGILLKDLAIELGEKKALDISMKFWDQMATAFAKDFKKQRESEMDLSAIAKANNDSMIKLGFDRKADVSPTNIVYTTKKCPLYEAFKQAGLSHDNIKAFCAGTTKIYSTKLKELYDPNSCYKLQFRASENDVCVEEMVLKA